MYEFAFNSKVFVMPRLHLTVLTTRIETWRW